MIYDEIISRVASDLGLSSRIVDRAYRATWRVIREYITSLPLKEDLTDEEFQKLRPNINIPALGKFNVTLDRYKRVKKYNKIKVESLKQNNNATYNKD